MINVQAIDIDTKGVVGFTRTMASMFEGCTNLKKDIIIPKNVDCVKGASLFTTVLASTALEREPNVFKTPLGEILFSNVEIQLAAVTEHPLERILLYRVKLEKERPI